jgi:CubicO group peptidase (beta-lactamase class C family)
MKREGMTQHANRCCKRLAIVLLTGALALTAVQRFRSAGANASPVLAAAATPTPKTDFDIYPLNAAGVVQAKSDGASWSGNVPGYNIVRTFKNIHNQSHVIMLNGNTGRGKTYMLNADGTLGTQTWATNNDVLSELRCTSAETVKIGNTTYLLTHDSLTGKVRTFHFYDNGQPNLGSLGVTTLSDWKDKNIFSLYYYEGAYYLLGVDTWTGNAVAYSINGQKIGEDDWTRGWTSVDHLAVGGVTYRLLYKAAGDPQKKPGEANDQLGRFVIQTVNANGVSGQNIYDAPLGADFSAVRFVPLYNGQNWEWHIFFFKRDTAHYVVRQFDKQHGIGAVTAFGIVKDGPDFNDVAPAYVDIEPYTIGVKTFVATVSDDNSTPFYFAQAEKMGQAIHDRLKNKAVGYQFMLAQSGRIIYSRAFGKAKLGATEANQVDMTSRTRLDLGSVSKVITATTMLKLAELEQAKQGKNILDEPITGYLQPGEIVQGTWAANRTIADLLKHTTGMNDQAGIADQCKAIDGTEADPETTCKDFFAATPSVSCNGTGCRYEYNNANIGAVREIIEYLTSTGTTVTKTTQDVTTRTHELWAHSVNLDGMTYGLSCYHNDEVKYFNRCGGNGGCFDFNNESWQQVDGDGWSGSCGAGGWRASSRQMIEFLGALRYQKIFSTPFNDLLLSTGLQDAYGGRTAIGWDPPWDADPSDGVDLQLGKNGKNPKGGAAMVAYITRLPNNADAVLLANTDVPVLQSLLHEAYRYGVGLSDAAPVFVDYTREDDEVAGQIGRLAINTLAGTAHVTAVSDSSGDLKLIRWDVDSADQIVRGGDATAGLVTEVALTEGEAFVTAVRASGGTLKVIAWTSPQNSPNSITRYGDATGVAASKIAVTKLAGSGTTQGRVVTAARNLSGNLRLDVWDFNNQTNQMTLKDTWTVDPVSNTSIQASEIAVRTLNYKSALDQTSRFATAIRNGDGKLQVDVWDVDGGGQLARKGTLTKDYLVSDVVDSTNKLAIGKWGLFALGQGQLHFFTAFINSDGKLRLASFEVSAAGAVTFKDYDNSQGGASEVSVTGGTTAVRSSTGDLTLYYWAVDPNTGVIKYEGGRSAGAISKVAAAGNVLTAVRLNDGTLKLINWELEW